MSENCQYQAAQTEEDQNLATFVDQKTQDLQPKRFPVTSRDKEAKKVFDSADYFMQKEKDRKENIDIPEIPIPDYPHAKTPVLKCRNINERKTFDSADYFMEQEKKKGNSSDHPSQAQENVMIDNTNAVVSEENQSQEEPDVNAERIANFPDRKRPILNRGRTVKKSFDSADYFMNLQKASTRQRHEAKSSIVNN